MTLHSAKGLEFDTVFIIGMEEGIFPLSRAIDVKEELEEERRLCYVGITRAMRKLYLTHASVRFQYGETRANPVSRFIQELPEDRCESILPKPVQRRQEYSSLYSSWDNDYDDFYDEKPSKRSIGEFKSTEKYTPSSNMGTLNYTRPATNNGNTTWKIAMTVKHRRFGTGKIVSVSGTGEKTMVTVAFENNGVKNLVAAQANLEVIGE
jgi:DNA helicase-2/ATP-dependent DNA helicase PcrA